MILALGLGLVVLATAMLTGALDVGRTAAHGPKVGREVPVTALDMKRMPSNNTPVLATDPTDPRVVVLANRIDAPAFRCALQISGDGGRTWATTAPLTALPPGADTCYAPEVAFDSSGILQYLFVGLHGEGNEPMGVFLSSSTDQGHTFAAPRRVLGPFSFGVRMAINTKIGRLGRLHLAWVQARGAALAGFVAEPNPVMTAYSDDGGVTFSTPVQVSEPARARVVGPVLTLGPDSVVHVGYYDLGGDARDYQGLEGPVWEGSWSVVVATSVDGGRRFGPGTVVDDQIAPPERPMLIFTMPPPALVADAARTCAAWTDARDGDPDVLLRCSTDRGATWGEVHRVNDDAVGSGASQYLPRLALAPGGRLDAIFLDRRYHPDNDQIDVTYSSSNDGGRSFAPNLRVTRESSSSQVGAEYAGPAAEGKFEIGGRLGLLSRRSGAILAWPDSRNSLVPGTGQDIVSAEVVSGAAAGQDAWAKGMGAVLLGAGILALAVAAVRRRRLHRAPALGDSGAPPGVHDGPRPDPSGRGRRPAWVLPVAVVGVVGLVGMVGLVATGSRGPTAFAGPQVVHVTMTEYGFQYDPPTRAGRVVFEVRNAGKEDHRAGIYLLPDDMPPIDVQLRGNERKPVERLADPLPRRPGESQSFAVDLVAGQRYALLCFVPAKEANKTHAQLGMNAEFRLSP